MLANNSLGLGAEWEITEQIEVLSECFSDVYYLRMKDFLLRMAYR